MSDTADKTTLTVSFSPIQIDAIDAWIARHDDPKPTREDAVCQLVAARLGTDEEHASTVLPSFVTGRDIV